jgi:hypothetical protein
MTEISQSAGSAQKRKFDGFCDRILLELAIGKRRKSPPVELLIERLIKRKRLAVHLPTGLFVGLLSNGENLVLAGMIPETFACDLI